MRVHGLPTTESLANKINTKTRPLTLFRELNTKYKLVGQTLILSKVFHVFGFSKRSISQGQLQRLFLELEESIDRDTRAYLRSIAPLRLRGKKE